MSFLDYINPFKPIIDKTLGIIDKAVPDKDLREKLKSQIQNMELDLEAKALDVRMKTIMTESQGSYWQRNWRPFTMLAFVSIIVWNYGIAPIFSLTVHEIPVQMWELIKLGLGGYVIGRSGEKIMKEYKK